MPSSNTAGWPAAQNLVCIGRSIAWPVLSAADREGWVTSEVLAVHFRPIEGTPPRLAVEDAADPTTRVEI